MGPSVLVVCGDEMLCAEMSAHLAQARINVQATMDVADAEASLGNWPFDIVLCDIDLPTGASGELITRLRMSTRCGIVALSSSPRRESRMLAMRLGADQFFQVPMDPEELELAIRNLHRRISEAGAPSRAQPQSQPQPAARAQGESSAWRLDITHWTLTCPQGQRTSLSFPEYRLLHRLTAAPGEVVTREDLAQLLGNGGVRVYGRNLDMMMSRLRRKVQKHCDEPLPVHSARGVGYVFNGRAQLQS